MRKIRGINVWNLIFETELRQGVGLSPNIFNLFLDKTIKTFKINNIYEKQ